MTSPLHPQLRQELDHFFNEWVRNGADCPPAEAATVDGFTALVRLRYSASWDRMKHLLSGASVENFNQLVLKVLAQEEADLQGCLVRVEMFRAAASSKEVQS